MQSYQGAQYQLGEYISMNIGSDREIQIVMNYTNNIFLRCKAIDRLSDDVTLRYFDAYVVKNMLRCAMLQFERLR